MDRVLERLAEIDWRYGDQDPVALAELTRRVEEVGRTKGDFLTYSELAQDVEFRIPTLHGGEPFQIDTANWSELDRALIGHFLGRMAADSYRAGRFFASALVVGATDMRPSEGFYRLGRDTGLLRSNSEDDRLALWIEHARRARDWYRAHSR